MLSVTITLGLFLGSIRIFGVRLGVSAVLFSAIVFGQLGFQMSPEALSFLRDFSLVIFVYAIGLQLGPGFVASLRASGVKLNVLAVAVVSAGAVFSAAIVHFFPLPAHTAVGIYTGGFTSTTGLAAGQEALLILFGHTAAGQAASDEAALAYTVTYPFGLIGPILIIVALKMMFGVRMQEEREALAREEATYRPPIETLDIKIAKPDLTGQALKDLQVLREHSITLARLLRDGKVVVPGGQTELQLGDVVRAVGPAPALEEMVKRLGETAVVDFGGATGDVNRIELVVTRVQVVGKSLRQLNLSRRLGVTVVRIFRGSVELPASGNLTLHFGDDIIAVGPAAGLKSLEAEMGNSAEALNRPQLIPLFVGIALGVMVGSIPFRVPGLKTTLSIGLAAGPMIVALILARLGNIGRIIWYMPAAASQLLRDFGMAVFLACIGVQAGDHFLQKLASGGVPLVLWGAVVTIVPMMLVAVIARVAFKMNFVMLAGLVSGAMTNSTTLVFANEFTQSEAPSLGYAAVYPLAMIVPIVSAQILATVTR